MYLLIWTTRLDGEHHCTHMFILIDYDILTYNIIIYLIFYFLDESIFALLGLGVIGLPL